MGQPFKEREMMKTVLLVLLTAGLVLCPGASVERAWSAEGDDGGHRPPGNVVGQLRHRLLHRFDENGNGRLDHREAHHAMKTVIGILSRHRGRPITISDLPAGLRPIFGMFDKNGDGILGPVEQRRLAHALRHAGRHPHPPKPPEKPGDGDAGERPERPGKPGRPERPGDGDGASDDGDEVGPDRPHPSRLTPELVRQLRALLLSAFDRNQNGHLDPPERAHARRVVLGFLSQEQGEAIEIASAPQRLAGILGLFDFNGDGKLGPQEKRLLRQALHIVLRHRPRPDKPGEPSGDRPERPRSDRPIGDDLDDGRPVDRGGDDGIEVRPGHPPRPDF